MECDIYRDEIRKLKYALECRGDFIEWLVEVYNEGIESMSELYEQFKKYEEDQSKEVPNGNI